MSYIDCRCWLVSQNLFRTRYAPHLLYASETDYSEPNVKEPEPKNGEDSELEPKVEEPKVEEFSIETLVDLSTEPIMGLLSLSLLMIFSLSLRSPDVYDPLQVFLQ